MKKVVALLLTLLLLSSAAFAEGVTIRELPQYRYINLSLINPEAYPEVRLMESFPTRHFSGRREPVFLCFPGPEGIPNVSYFDSYAVRYTDAERLIQYSYYMRDSDSFEEFLNRAPDDESILLDGSDGVAAYYSLYYGEAYGMLPVKEFGKNVKLLIEISLAYLDDKMPEATQREALTTAILSEVDRVRNQMRFETYSGYWSEGMYDAVKILDDDFKYLVCLNIPSLTKLIEGTVSVAPLIITKVDGPRIKGVFDYGNGKYIEFDTRLILNLYIQSKK